MIKVWLLYGINTRVGKDFKFSLIKLHLYLKYGPVAPTIMKYAPMIFCQLHHRSFFMVPLIDNNWLSKSIWCQEQKPHERY